MTPLQPLVKHPGGKRQIADRVFEALGRPAELCEPFAGGLAVSLVSGARPRFVAEAIPVLRQLYQDLAERPAELWAELDALPSLVCSRDQFEAMRRTFNRRQTPAGYLTMSYACFNGLARFNPRGEFNAAVGAPLPRVIPRWEDQREAFAEAFRDCQVFADWRDAVSAAAAGGVPVYADPPYVGTFAYGRTRWTLEDLGELARALPVGSLVSERAGVEPDALPLFGEPTVEATLEAAGFELVFHWTGRNSISRGARTERPEGVWRKAA